MSAMLSTPQPAPSIEFPPATPKLDRTISRTFSSPAARERGRERGEATAATAARSGEIGGMRQTMLGAPIPTPDPDAPKARTGSSAGEDSQPCDQLRQTLARASQGTGEPQERWRPLTRVRLASGDRVPGTRYEIVRWLGEGGMGMVFEAVHVDLRRSVALKILKPSATGHDDRDRERFLNEARTLAQIHSNHVVEAFDFGELPDGRPFYAMELLQPKSLDAELCDGEPLPLDRVIAILRQCCKALADVHAQGVAHRDIKPENVLLQECGGRPDCVRLVDFGIAAPFGSSPQLAGTLLYMAPEQLRDTEFDQRLDIYGLGCLAFEMLTGEPPFTARNAPGLISAHLETPPPKLSDRRPELPRELDAVLDKCLAKRPEARYADVHELEVALCEVQIATGLTTGWDDLPLPEVDEARREALARDMPRLRQRRRRRLGRRLLIACGAFAIGVASAMSTSVSADSPSVAASVGIDPDTEVVEELFEDARAAGSMARWVYPPNNEPDASTALELTYQLEGHGGPARPMALLRAAQLRAEFSKALVRLGDRYWGEPHGEPFAVEFYAQALLFDPDLEHARERVGMSTPQLANLQNRLVKGEYTEFERELGAVLGVLAEQDTERRSERAAELLADEIKRPTSLRVNDQLAEVAGVPERAESRRGAGLVGVDQGEADADQAAPAPDQGEADADADADAEVEDAAPAASEDDAQTARSNVEFGGQLSRAVARSRARELSREGERALNWGRHGRARNLFDQALDLDRSHAPALAGMARVDLATGNTEAAYRNARKAASNSPKSADIQLLLGDASAESGRESEARTAYEAAERLGSHKAKWRLRTL
ncbi:protein kinase [Pseudenhygromyxa sp. WMMC2535]|uniref:serine/threonine-protein kinase n=1 Tax=Pseudenhygromyxa sp. WMMC2535 TaxID=2712867 RepID=UPI00155454AD|nr:serine/threonine-protein kinase [Pseudenhygromyxa sp. WMMC2535]NVB38964.1 protein kinase [Pseudenhygromyxa sp. WMMC2535]